MKTTLIITSLLSLFVAKSQNTTSTSHEKKHATIQIKKIENINGVEKITDTTYTTDNIELIAINEETAGIFEGKDIKMIEIKGEELNSDLSEAEKSKKLKELMDEMQKFNQERTEKMAADLQKDGQANSTKVCRNTIVTIHVSTEEPNKGDLQKINKEHGEIDGKLKVKDLRFFPNPSNGNSVNLSFELTEKGDATVDVLDMNGKSVYQDKLNAFTGKYNNNIDLSNKAKGIYFVKVSQGGHSQISKIIVE